MPDLGWTDHISRVEEAEEFTWLMKLTEELVTLAQYPWATGLANELRDTIRAHVQPREPISNPMRATKDELIVRAVQLNANAAWARCVTKAKLIDYIDRHEDMFA